MRTLVVDTTGPAVTIQDLGRPGFLAVGLSRGGAADTRALTEAAALLGAPGEALEMAGFGGRFRLEGGNAVIALTGAPMRARLDGKPLAWNASHAVAAGQVLDIGPAVAGLYSYVSFDGGLATPVVLGARSAHLNAGLGRVLAAGDRLPLGAPAPAAAPGMILPADDRFSGGLLRALPSPQAELFSEDTRQAFEAAQFTRTARGNRMGVELDGGRAFGAEGGLTLVSEMIAPGDIQMTGAGAPFILGPECQTTGGYPRIATVIPCDLPRALQAPPGARLKVVIVSRDEALAAYRAARQEEAALRARPMVRDPNDIDDLLSYQLIGGVYEGDAE